jgi:NADP+-dependent farnesol dehydrogenase
MIVGFSEFFQSVSPGVVETEAMEASEFPKDMMKNFKDIPSLISKDIADAVIYVLGTPPHVQVGTVLQYTE